MQNNEYNTIDQKTTSKNYNKNFQNENLIENPNPKIPKKNKTIVPNISTATTTRKNNFFYFLFLIKFQNRNILV